MFLCQVLQIQAMILLTSSSLGSPGVGANSFLCLAQILTHALIYLSSHEACQELPCFIVVGDWTAVRWDCPFWWHFVIYIVYMQDNNAVKKQLHFEVLYFQIKYAVMTVLSSAVSCAAL